MHLLPSIEMESEQPPPTAPSLHPVYLWGAWLFITDGKYMKYDYLLGEGNDRIRLIWYVIFLHLFFLTCVMNCSFLIRRKVVTGCQPHPNVLTSTLIMMHSLVLFCQFPREQRPEVTFNSHMESPSYRSLTFLLYSASQKLT